MSVGATNGLRASGGDPPSPAHIPTPDQVEDDAPVPEERNLTGPEQLSVAGFVAMGLAVGGIFATKQTDNIHLGRVTGALLSAGAGSQVAYHATTDDPADSPNEVRYSEIARPMAPWLGGAAGASVIVGGMMWAYAADYGQRGGARGIGSGMVAGAAVAGALWAGSTLVNQAREN